MNESSKINETPEALIKSSRENGASGVQREHFTPLSDYGYGGRDASEGIPLRNYWRSIRKRKWLVILITMVITTLVLLYVARQPDPNDRRRQIVRIQEDAIEPIKAAYAPMQVEMFKLWSSYRAQDLEVITDFITRSTQLQAECLERLKAGASPPKQK